MIKGVISSVTRLAFSTLLLLVLSSPVWAQCAMCREAAASQQAEAIEALNLGIVLLAIPPAAILIGIGCVTYRHRDFYRGETPRKPISE